MDHGKTSACPARFTMAAAAVSALFAAAGASAQYLHSPDMNRTPINGNLPAGAFPSSWDPTYNVCRGTDPKCYHNWVNNRQMRVLVYSRTAGPRHGHLGPNLTAGKNTQSVSGGVFSSCTPNTTSCPAVTSANIAQFALRTWLNAEGILVDVTEDVNQLSGLNSYRAVIFMSPTRDTMWKHGTAIQTNNTNLVNNTHLDAAKTALRQYMRAGGGFVGIHNVFGTEYNWPYYEGMVGNANYYDHGADQNGTVHLVGTDPSTNGLPLSWTTRDEWYNMQPYPTNVKVVLRLDELTLATRTGTHPGHGDFSPRVWCQNYDGGHVWVTPIGHSNGFFQDASTGNPTNTFAGQAEFKRLVVQGIKMTMGVDAALGSGTPTSPPPNSTTFCTR